MNEHQTKVYRFFRNFVASLFVDSEGEAGPEEHGGEEAKLYVCMYVFISSS